MEGAKLVAFTASAGRADKLCKTIAYTCGALGRVLAHSSPKHGDTAVGLQQLAGSISMARYILRFPGTFEAYEALQRDSWCLSDDSKDIRNLVRLQAYSMLLYHPLEHVSYIGYVAPKLLKVDADRYSRQSCVIWAMYIVLDMYINYQRINALKEKEKQAMASKDIKTEELQAMLSEIRLRRRELYYVQLRNACYFTESIHWSVDGGVFPEPLIAFCCFTESVVGLWRAWINFA